MEQLLSKEQIWQMAEHVASFVVENNNSIDTMSRADMSKIEPRCAELIEHPSNFDGKDYEETKELDYFKTLVNFRKAVMKRKNNTF